MSRFASHPFSSSFFKVQHVSSLTGFLLLIVVFLFAFSEEPPGELLDLPGMSSERFRVLVHGLCAWCARAAFGVLQRPRAGAGEAGELAHAVPPALPQFAECGQHLGIHPAAREKPEHSLVCPIHLVAPRVIHETTKKRSEAQSDQLVPVEICYGDGELDMQHSEVWNEAPGILAPQEVARLFGDEEGEQE
jgi:hypothetical protein